MNVEVHIVPLGQNSWAVRVGKTSYQAFDSQEKALQFGKRLCDKKENCQVFVHDREGNENPVQSDRSH